MPGRDGKTTETVKKTYGINEDRFPDLRPSGERVSSLGGDAGDIPLISQAAGCSVDASDQKLVILALAVGHRYEV